MSKFILFFSILAFHGLVLAAPLKIQLTTTDQARLAKELSKIDIAFHHEEVDQSVPYLLVYKHYNFLDVRYAFSVGCWEKFINASVYASDAECSVIFDSDLTNEGAITIHKGFIPEYIIAKVNDSELSRILYKAIGNGSSPKVFFNSQEKISFTHPSTGEAFEAHRLRIECERNLSYSEFSCMISAIK